MKKLTILFIAFVCAYPSLAQINELGKKENQVLEHFEMIADKGYTIERIMNDSSLPFTTDKRLNNFDTNKIYWIKCTVNNPMEFAKEFYLSIFPIMDNTIYYYHKEEKKWVEKKAGLAIVDGMHKVCYLPIVLYPQANTFYIKMDVHTLAKYKHSTHAHMRLVDMTKFKKNDQTSYIYWIITLVIIFLLFLYNLYTYYVFRDKAFLYYLLIIVGSIFYITALNKFFNILLPFRYFQVLLSKEGYIYSFDINSVLLEIAIILILTGFVQFTRHYLQTKIILPKWDKVLRYLNLIFITVTLFTTFTTITGIWYNFYFFTLYLNSMIVLLILLIIVIGILAYQRKHPFAKYFLLANVSPLILMLCIAIYFILTPTVVYGVVSNLLPNLAILSLIITFGISLSARINVLKKDLGNEQLQAQLIKNNLLESEQSNKEKDIFLKEIHHRVKNNLQIISSLLYMQFKDHKDEHMIAQLRQAQERIKSMALVHNKLYETNDTVHVYIKEYIKDLAMDILKSNTPNGTSIALYIQEKEPINLSLDTSISLGLILNELITNSCKYAFTNKRNGQIDITIEQQPNGYQLIVKDDGVGLPENFAQKNSLGVRLVTNLAKQIGGKANFDNQNGTVVTIQFRDANAA